MRVPGQVQTELWTAVCHGGSSSSSTRREQHITDRRIGATDGAIVAAEGAEINLEDVSDRVAEAAFEFATGEGEGSREVVADALELIGGGLETLADVTTSSSEAVSQALELEQQREVQGLAGLEKTLQAVTIIGVAGAAAWAFSRG